MKLFDRNAKKNIGRYIVQSIAAGSMLMVVLFFLNAVDHPAILATLGATFFIVFTMPRSYPASRRPLIGGYIIGISIGLVFHYFSANPIVTSYFVSEQSRDMLFGALAVATAIFCMVCTDTEHPPAAGLALAILISEWDIRTIIFLLGVVVILSIIKQWFEPLMLDLS